MRSWRADLPWPKSLGARLTLWNTAVALAMTVASLLAARFTARATLDAAADAELRSGVREIVLAIQDLHPDLDAVVDVIRRKARSHEERGWFSQLLTADGVTLWKSDHCPEAVADFPPSNLDRVENVVQVGPYRYVRLRLDRPGLTDFHLRVGTYTTGLDGELTVLVRQLAIMGLGLSLLTPLVGSWLARRATRPVARLLDAAAGLQPTRLGDRLPVRGIGDELDQLAVTVNRLLDQVAAHVDRQEQFVADAAHELRGPLTAVRSTLEVALARDRPGDDLRETLADVLEETRHLSTLANGLLVLADGATADQAATRLDLATLVRQTAEMFAGVAEERGLAITAEGDPAWIFGHAGQLRQVMGNLLDNALRFTPPGGRIRLRVQAAAAGDGAVITVADSGEGIAAEHRLRVFDRFYKVDPGRGREGGRTGGLGLAICKAIVERHGGAITLDSEPGRGTTVTVTLPTADPPRAADAERAAAVPAATRA